MSVVVAVAVIADSARRVLITRRPAQASHGGLWEFPGGKLEEGEAAEQALRREIHEEVGLEITQSQFLGDVHHAYPHKDVTLRVFWVDQFTGQAACCEQQMDLRWVSVDQLSDYAFPEANYKILQWIRQHDELCVPHGTTPIQDGSSFLALSTIVPKLKKMVAE